MREDFDVIVIGAGPSGYHAAIRSAQLGLRTAVVDAFEDRHGDAALGGTCLNVGCIPAKALLDSSKQFYDVLNRLGVHGISVEKPSINLKTMLSRKDQIIAQFTGGLAHLFKMNQIETYHGRGHVISNHQVAVRSKSGNQLITTRNIILAPGSLPTPLPSAPFDHADIIDSTDAMELTSVPSRLGIVGAGVVGLELGSVWRRLGAQVIILEADDRLLRVADADVVKIAAREMNKQGIDIIVGARVTSVSRKDKEVNITYKTNGGDRVLIADKLLVSIGRKPNVCGLWADDVGILLDQQGRISVDEHFQTTVPGIWAVGDAIRGPMLAHKGFEEGVAVAETIAGVASYVNYDVIPCVIYTDPEIAWVGKTEDQLKNSGVPYSTGVFPFSAVGRAVAMDASIGFVKVIAAKDSDRILGVHMVGPEVSELIGEAVLAMEFEASAEDFAKVIHAHPTLSEALREAMLALHKRAIHKKN